MLNIQEVVNFVNEKLNTDENITFNVRAEIGESDKESLINGILRTAQAKTTPIKDYVENKYVFVCELSVPTGRTNKMFLKVQDIVSEFADSYNGNELEFTNGKATINCSLGKPEDFKVAYNVGDCTPLYFTIDMIYTESGVMSIQKKWYLSDDGTNFYEIPYETESVVVNKEGITRKVDFDKYTKTLLTGQTKFYKFKFPYQNTTLGNMLMKDILNGDFKKQYTLKYVDGINYTSDNLDKPPYTTKVSLYMSGDINSQVVNVGKFDVTFTDVDDGNTTTKYYIGLIDWLFDASGEDTAWFASQSDQQTYFNTKVSTANGGTGWQQIQAPNLNSIFITSQIFPNTSTPKLNIFDLARKNYAIIKIVKTEGLTTTTQYIYYHATNCQIGADGQVTYDLKEDTVQTLLPNARLSIADSFIVRCHTNRWFYDEITNNYAYDFSKTSSLFEKEEINSVAKITTKKQQLKLQVDASGINTNFNKWYNDYIDHWIYVYMDAENYKSKNADDTQLNTWYEMSYFRYDTDSTKPHSEYEKSSLAVFCYPVYKNIRTIGSTTTGYLYEQFLNSQVKVRIDGNGFEKFLELNGGYTTAIKAIKRSLVPPVYISASTDYQIEGSGNFANMTILNAAPVYTFVDQAGVKHGILSIYGQNLNNYTKMYVDEAFYVNEYPLGRIRDNNQGSGIPDPKLYNEDYSVYNVYFGGQTYEMPVSKTSPKPAFRYYEALTPDLTKFYLAFDIDSSNTENSYGTSTLFNSNNVKDFTGLVGTIDLSLWFKNEQLDEWLAQNKNNLQIFQNNQGLAKRTADLNMGMGLAGGAIGAALSIAGGFVGMAGAGLSQTTNQMGSIAGGIGGLAGIATSVTNRIKTDWQLENEATNRELTIDNMRQAPDRLSSVNSNSIFMSCVDNLGIYIELQQAISHELKHIEEQLKRYGYTYNKIDNVKNMCNIRRKYNYVKAIIGALSGLPISTEERLDFKQRFESGLRFWTRESGYDFVIDYSAINYEKALEPPQE